MRVAIYARVSQAGQSIENQVSALTEVGQRVGWDVVEVFADDGISGAKGREKRPGFDRLLKGLARKDFDLVAAWSVDRVGRSVMDLLAFLGELHARDIGLYLHQQGLDTSTPSGRASYQLLAVFAEFERAMLSDRVKASLHRLKAEGVRLGRPELADEKREAVRRELLAGRSVRQAARVAGCSVGSAHKVRASLRATA